MPGPASIVTGTFGTDVTSVEQMIPLLETMMTARGWVFVEEVAATSPAALPRRVWQNPASNNIAGVDFYVILHNFTANNLYFQIFEEYDVATKAITKYTPGATTNVVPNADGSYPGAAGVATTWNVTNQFPGTAAYANGLTYWLVVDADHIIIGIRNGTQDNAYLLGAAHSAQPNRPLIMLHPISTASAGGRTTRETRTNASANNWQANFNSTVTFSASANASVWVDPILSSGQVESYSGKSRVARPTVQNSQGSTFIYGHMTENTVVGPDGVNGDTITVNGVLYTCVKTGTNCNIYHRSA